MAVQARQYPSSPDLLLNRNLQEGAGLESSPQPPQLEGPEFLNQRRMLFSNGASSSTQKRTREVLTAPFPFQQNPQLVDLSQHRNHQGISTGLLLSFPDKQQQHKSLLHSSLLSSDEFAAQIKRQREETAQLVHIQGEQLRETLSKMRRRLYQTVITAAEYSVGRKLAEKEAEAERAARRNAELEACAAQLTVEVQIWQFKAKAHESTTATLQAQLQQAMVSGGGEGRMAAAADANSAYIDPDWSVLPGLSCKACRRRVATVVVLPCQHLSVCTGCDGSIIVCPVCFSSRNSSVKVSLY